MRRHLRAIVTLGMLFLYSGTALLGQGMHVLFCCEHVVDDQILGGQILGGHAADRSGSASQENPGPDAFAAGAGSAGAIEAAHDHHEADCPICQFHSQGQLAVAGVEPSVRPLPAGAIECAAPRINGCEPSLAYSPRGPPLG
jgi:hypothetical protein